MLLIKACCCHVRPLNRPDNHRAAGGWKQDPYGLRLSSSPLARPALPPLLGDQDAAPVGRFACVALIVALAAGGHGCLETGFGLLPIPRWRTSGTLAASIRSLATSPRGFTQLSIQTAEHPLAGTRSSQCFRPDSGRNQLGTSPTKAVAWEGCTTRVPSSPNPARRRRLRSSFDHAPCFGMASGKGKAPSSALRHS